MENKTLYEKLLLAQQEIGAITKSKDNPFFKSKYADINVILAEVKPILNKNGLVLTQALCVRDTVAGIETAIVEAETGKGMYYFCPLPIGQTPQQTGSAITYFRRYALQSLLALESEDDDGAVASETTKKVDKTKEDTPF